ncbi:MAG: hypothetical protein L0312_08990 [Acidobacteria bacterium]|nr:hypothetical protein [Acidobacteriota bacterium]
MAKALGVPFLSLLLCATLSLFAAAGETGAEPVKRELQLIYVFDGQKTEYIFVIGQSGFKSVAALKQHLETWAPGSELKWAPGCERFGDERWLRLVGQKFIKDN